MESDLVVGDQRSIGAKTLCFDQHLGGDFIFDHDLVDFPSHTNFKGLLMNSVFHFEDHKHFPSDSFSIESWSWIIVEKRQSVIFIYDFFSFSFESPKLLTANFGILNRHRPFHILEISDLFFEVFDSVMHFLQTAFGLLHVFLLFFGLMFDRNFFILKGFDLFFEIDNAGLFLFYLLFNQFKGFFLVGGFCKVIKQISSLLELFFGLNGLFFVPLNLLFESFALLFVFRSLFFEVK